jgi:peptidoglycan-associated lipoprotein
MRMRGFSVASGALTHLALLVAGAVVAAGCGDKNPKYPGCDSDKDCQTRARGEHCVNKRCRQCASDGHCKKGETCIDGSCVLAPGACNADPDCTNGEVCRQNRCVACQGDSQCGADRRCRDGRCLSRGKCARDDDCADDEDCVKGACRRPGRSVPPDVNCQLAPVYFGFDQAGLADPSRGVLDQVAQCVQSAPGRGLLLSGYTDPRGTEEYNIALSERRAHTVANYLARLGIDPARFRVVPRGETLASGSDESGWSRDRRVEIEWQ